MAAGVRLNFIPLLYGYISREKKCTSTYLGSTLACAWLMFMVLEDKLVGRE